MRVDGFPDVFGAKRIGCIAMNGPVAYAADGFEVEARALGIRHIHFAVAMGSSSGDYFAVARVSSTNGTSVDSCFVQVFVGTTGVEVANGINLSGETFRVMAFGL